MPKADSETTLTPWESGSDLPACPFCDSRPFVDLSGSTRNVWCPNDQCGIVGKSMLDCFWQQRVT